MSPRSSTSSSKKRAPLGDEPNEVTQIVSELTQIRALSELQKVGKKKRVAAPEASAPKQVLIGLWIVLAVVSLWEIDDLRETAAHNEVLGQSEKFLAVLGGISWATEKVGLQSLRGGVLALTENIRSRDLKVPQDIQDERDKATADAKKEVQKEQVVEAGGRNVRQARAPKHILLVGASSIQFYLGAELARQFESYEGVTVDRFGKLSTGLARPDLFDWPKEMKSRLNRRVPDLVVGMFGGNDAQNMTVGKKTLQYGSAEWDLEYMSRVKAMVEMVKSKGSQMVMLGMPTMRLKAFHDKIKHVNELTQLATEGAGGVYIDTWDINADSKGDYKATVTFEGETGLARLSDGIHHSRLGARYTADKLRRRFERNFNLIPEDKNLAAAVRFDVESTARGRYSTALAYVPQNLKEGEKVPLLMFLHGAEGGWQDYSEQVHDVLQKMANDEKLVIVTPDGDPFGWYLDSDKVRGGKVETYFIQELVPTIEALFPVAPVHGIAGLSMGGHGALSLALKNPNVFISGSAMSGAVNLARATDRESLIDRLGPYEKFTDLWHKNSARHLFEKNRKQAMKQHWMVTCGDRDHLWTEGNRELHQVLTTLKIPHKWEETDGAHTWTYWRTQVPKHLLFHARVLHEALRAQQTPVAKQEE